MDARSEARDAVRIVRLAAASGPRLEPVSWSYRLILAAVAALVVALPLVYVSLVFGAFALLHRHAVEAALELQRNSLGFGFVVAYALPALAAFALTGFLLKPFVAPRPEPTQARLATRASEPALYAFVDALCQLVGAPRPAVIEISCDVNAGADLRHGMQSLRDGALVLTVGLPLFAGLDLKELAGVLAHELGHFSQRAGLRLLHVVRAMNRWFERAVYGQDLWDQALARLVASPWPGVRGIVLLGLAALSTGVISISRVVLWSLMMVAHAVSATLLRQLELDADRVHVSVVGSECFERTLLRMAMLAEGTERAARTLEDAWAQGRLGDDLTALIVDHADGLDEAERAEVEDRFFAPHQDPFASHPAPRDRIAAVAAMRARGVLDLDGRSTVLFQNFPGYARRLTLSEYKRRLGPEVTPDTLVSTRWIHAQRAEIHAFERAALRYLGAHSTPARPLSIGLAWIPPPGAFEDECRTIHEAREGMVAVAPKLRRAAALARGDHFQRQVAEITLAELEDHAARRLASTLRLLESGAGLDGLAEVERMRARVRELRAALVVFEPTLPALAELGRDREEIERLGFSLDDRERAPWATRKLMRLVPRMAIKLIGIRAPLAQHPFPFAHATRDMTIGRYALEGLPDITDPATVLETTYQLTERLLRFYTRVLGELATIAEAVEQAVGFAPLDLSPPVAGEAADAATAVA